MNYLEYTAGKRIRGIKLGCAKVLTWQKTELAIEMDIPKVNLFDEAVFALDIKLANESGRIIKMPGFYSVPHSFKPTGELLAPITEQTGFRFRISLPEAGKWSFSITLRENGEAVETVTGSIIAVDSGERRGIMCVEPTHGRNFVFENRELYLPVGQNLCWTFPVQNPEKQARYITRIIRTGADYGMNYVRLWMIFWSLSFQKQHLAPDDFSGGQGNAAQMDKIFDVMTETGVYTSLVFFTHGMFSRKNNPVWDNNPFNINNTNGYLKDPPEFFTNERAKKDTKSFIRYIVARYGYSRNVMTWEFFNEADIADGEMPEKISWHAEMTEYIRSVDPYNHMVTTSGAYADCPISREDMFDFTYIHWYDYPKLRDMMNFQKADWAVKKRPSFYGEIGLTNAKPHIDADLITFHQTNWAGMMGGSAATAMTWFWEELDRVDGYSDYAPLSEFAAGIPWTAPDFDQLDTPDLVVNNPRVEIIGYGGADYSDLWMYDDEYNQYNKEIIKFENVQFIIPIKNGNYKLEWFCPWRGEVLGTERGIAQNSSLEVKAPLWTRDLALRVRAAE